MSVSHINAKETTSKTDQKVIDQLSNSRAVIQATNKEPIIPAVRTRHQNFGPWFITVSEGPILPIDHIDKLQEKIENERQKLLNLPDELKAQNMPDMIFQDNLFALSYLRPDPNLPNKSPKCESSFNNQPPLFTIKFTANNALKYIQSENFDWIEVSSAKNWQQTRDLTKAPIKFQGNWTFSTTYTGCLDEYSEQLGKNKQIKFERAPDNHSIDYSRLKDRSNPIAMSEDIVLYEDELDDNGQSQLRLRFRLMKDCFFILLRCYVRIDGVLIRMIETRLFGLRKFW